MSNVQMKELCKKYGKTLQNGKYEVAKAFVQMEAKWREGMEIEKEIFQA